MEFLSISFLVLFSVSFLIYCLVGKRFRNSLLLLASFVFIGWLYPPFLITAVAVALFTFFWAQLLERKPTQLVYVSGIALLVFSWIALHYTGIVADAVHLFAPAVSKESVMHSLVFPLGMSFYTFQAIGYLTDVYWQDEKAERNFPAFLLYMLFFMKFLSGPIERPGHLLHQLKNPEAFNYQNAVLGMKFILLGLMKKLLIANHIAPHLDIMFNTVDDLSGLQLLMTCLLYPIQLYADFSGYTDIAIGGAKMFGIDLSPNFNRPFIAKSTADLWRRWHMSLSFWIRDYLYVPITAATRGWGRWGLYFSLLSTFFLLGLWHGLGITFAIYGLIQGIIICLETRITFFRTYLPKWFGRKVADILFIVRTYLLFAVSLLFFRANSLHDACRFLTGMSLRVHESWKEMNVGIGDHSCIVAGSALLLLLIFEHYNDRYDLMHKMDEKSPWLRWTVYYLLVFALFTLGKFDYDNFIYAQF